MAFQFFDKTGKAILRAQERVNKLSRTRAQAAEQTDAALDAHTEALRVEATLSDRNQDRIVRGDDLLDGAAEAENVRKTALAFAERERYQGTVERQLKEAEHELAAAIAQQRTAQGREVATKLRASGQAFVALVSEFRTHLPDAMPLLLGAVAMMEMAIRDCDAFARGAVAPSVTAAPKLSPDAGLCARCKHEQASHRESGCLNCDRNCRAFAAQAVTAPQATGAVRFVESFHGRIMSGGMKSLPAYVRGEQASFAPEIVELLCDDLKVAIREIAPVETVEPSPEAA